MTECAICLDIMEKGIVTLDCCKQNIHLDCLFKSLRTKPSCPYCRTDYNIPEAPERQPSTLGRKIVVAAVASCVLGFYIYILCLRK